MRVNKKIMLYGSIFFFQKLNISKDVEKKSYKKYFIFNKATACGYGKKMFLCKLGNVVVSSCMNTHTHTHTHKQCRKSVTNFKAQSMTIRHTLQG